MANYVKNEYYVTFGSGDASDTIEDEIMLTDEEYSIYQRAIEEEKAFEDYPDEINDLVADGDEHEKSVEFLDAYYSSEISIYYDSYCYCQFSDLIRFDYDSNANLELAKRTLTLIPEVGDKCAELFNKFIREVKSSKDNRVHMDSIVYEYHANIVIAVALAIKIFVCPKVIITLEFQTSRYSNAPDMFCAIAPFIDTVKVMESKRSYGSFCNKIALIGEYSLKFNGDNLMHKYASEICETLSVGDKVKLKYFEEYGDYSNCVGVLDKDGLLFGIIQMYNKKTVKKNAKMLEGIVSEVKPLSKRSRGTKYPMVKIQMEYVE